MKFYMLLLDVANPIDHQFISPCVQGFPLEFGLAFVLVTSKALHVYISLDPASVGFTLDCLSCCYCCSLHLGLL